MRVGGAFLPYFLILAVAGDPDAVGTNASVSVVHQTCSIYFLNFGEVRLKRISWRAPYRLDSNAASESFGYVAEAAVLGGTDRVVVTKVSCAGSY